MGLCKVCKKEKNLRKDGFCSTICYNKTKIKSIDGYKKCLFCGTNFPFRSTLKVRSCFSKKFNCLIGHINQKHCSKHCSLSDRNLNNNPAKTELGRKKISISATKRGTAHLHTPEVRQKQRQSITGAKHWNWQGGKTGEIRKIRNSFEMKNWRKSVFERDNYTCVFCGEKNFKGNGKNVKLNADHIKSFSSIIQENNINNVLGALHCHQLWDINNGRTLCLDCHKKTDSFAGRAYNKNKLSPSKSK